MGLLSIFVPLQFHAMMTIVSMRTFLNGAFHDGVLVTAGSGNANAHQHANKTRR
jgi:hypothetical protein